MAPVVRFAPSPTGLLHIGNARTALLNALFARREGGTFVLRFDDTDLERSRPEFAQAIEEDLAWLAIPPDMVMRQSERFDFYASVAERLNAMGRLYACYETPDELERRRRRQLGRGLPPIYDRAALKLTDEERAKLEAEGRRPHWRFLLDHRTVAWGDLVRGDSHVDCASLSDPVLVREDGSYLYTLPSVADDIDFAVTHVIRGEDHAVNTAVQIEIFQALAGSAPQFAHHSLLTDSVGKGLSKRLGSLTIGSLRESGIEPMAVVSHAALLGTSESIVPHHSMESLIEGFDLDKLSRAPARFDEGELRTLNAKLLHGMEYTAVAEALRALGIDEGPQFREAIRGNVASLGEARQWHEIVRGRISTESHPEDKQLLSEAKALL